MIHNVLGRGQLQNGLHWHDVAASRNTIGAALQQWFIFPHNDGYHETHHVFPSIPWFLLHEANDALLEEPYYKEFCVESKNLYMTAEYMSKHSITMMDN